MAKQNLIIKHTLALGDTVCFTALTRDIERAYPGKFNMMVQTHFSDVWWNNPFARKVEDKDYKVRPAPLKVTVGYREGIRRTGRGEHLHMIRSYHEDFMKKTGMTVPVTEPCGDIHFRPEEELPLVDGRYWVMLSGGKMDVTIKHWWAHRWQGMVNALTNLGVHLVQAGVLHKGHTHPPMENTLNLVGKMPKARDLMNLIAHADGVICPITAAMHIAACFDKPCVIIAGGREEPWWEGYVNGYGAFGPGCRPVRVEHKYLHTLGQLHCCDKKGCWKHRVVKLGLNDKFDRQNLICKEPVVKHQQAVAKCMDMITVDHVVEAVMGYYEDGTVPPIGQPKKKYSHAIDGSTPPAPGPPTDDEIEVIPPNKLAITPILMPLGDEGPEIAEAPAAAPSADVTKPRLVGTPLDQKGRPIQAATAKHAPPQPRAHPPSNLQVMDHPIIGNKITVFVLCYGDHADLAKKCLGSIMEHVPISRLDIRVGCNACSQQTLDYLKTLPLTKMYVYPQNKKKYPVMREMFWDPSCPINTNYVIWFDDDTRIADANWMSKLCETIVANHPKGSRLFGWRMIHNMQMYAKNGHRPDTWFRTANWYKGRHFKVRGQGQEAPNGTILEFVSGWFWALSAETIKVANIPDPRLNHNGGDITIGEQVHQAGFRIKMFNKDKSIIWCPKKEAGGRRILGGLSMVKTGPSLVFDSLMLYTMLSDPAFFKEVPAYAFMKQQVDAVRKQVIGVLTGTPECVVCGSMSTVMRPVMQTFTSHTIQMHQDSPEVLEQVAKFVVKKRGYRPKKIKLFHKQDGKVAALEW